MTTTTSARTRISTAVAAALVSAGLLAGGSALAGTHSQSLADYGADISADNSEAHSAEGGVRHMDDHRHAPGYFERMDGVDE